MTAYHHVSDPALVREVLRRAEDFGPGNALTAVEPLAPAARRVLARSGFALPPVLASATGQLHRTVRGVVARFFSPARVAAREESVRSLTRQVLDRELPAGTGDLALVTRTVPAAALAPLIGVDPARLPPGEQLHRWSLDGLVLFWGRPGPEHQVELAHSAAAFSSWLAGLVEDTRRDPATVFGALGAAGIDVVRLRSLAFFLLIAGQTTTGLLVNTVLHRALAEPAAWRAAAAGADALVAEALAEDSSVPTWRRSCPADTELDGRTVPAGTELLLHLSGHGGGAGLAFGHGLHRCLGAQLARSESAWMVEEIARAVPHARSGGAGPRLELLSFSAPLTVPIETPAGSARRPAP
ncbi:cytochrome P450 [Kocuria sp. M1R5S2]|uniref:cytochrome P450 n=1 Tax=Kocuria rhizosphaerae TaxID=3376285 RepID=UPI0037AF83D6